MSPLKDMQPSALQIPAEAQAVKASPAAEKVATANLENVPIAPGEAKRWTEIQRRAYHGSGIFDAAPAPAAAPRPDVAAPSAAAPVSVEAVAAEAAVDPSKMALKDLRAACRERGLNPGGGKDQLCDRLLEAIATNGAAPLAASSSAARDVSVAAGVKRDAGSERFADKNALGDSATRAAKAAKTDAFAAAAAFEARVRSADAFLADVMNSPKRGHDADSRVVTVSDAKLRDIGVGADIFFERGPEPGLDARKPNATAAAKAKAKEAAGHGDLFVATTDASQGVGVKKPSLVSRPAGATDMHEPTHRIFSSEVDDSAADPHEATRKLVGGKQVSETLKRSLFEGSKLFDDDAEREAFEANATRVRAKDDGESRVTASKHREGHGIFSEAWVVPREVAEGEAIDGDVPIEPARPADAEDEKALMNASFGDANDATSHDDIDADDGFKPIGACSPCVDLRWKTEEEEEAEEAVAILVYEAIRRVLDRASREAFYAEEKGK